MIQILQSWSGCEVEAAPFELRAIAELLRCVAKDRVTRTVDCAVVIDPTPYEASLCRLIAKSHEGKDLVSLSDGALVISGTEEGLNRIASFFDISDVVFDGYHNHHEYFAGHSHIDPVSYPLVVSARRKGKSA